MHAKCIDPAAPDGISGQLDGIDRLDIAHHQTELRLDHAHRAAVEHAKAAGRLDQLRAEREVPPRSWRRSTRGTVSPAGNETPPNAKTAPSTTRSTKPVKN